MKNSHCENRPGRGHSTFHNLPLPAQSLWYQWLHVFGRRGRGILVCWTKKWIWYQSCEISFPEIFSENASTNATSAVRFVAPQDFDLVGAIKAFSLCLYLRRARPFRQNIQVWPNTLRFYHMIAIITITAGVIKADSVFMTISRNKCVKCVNSEIPAAQCVHDVHKLDNNYFESAQFTNCWSRINLRTF